MHLLRSLITAYTALIPHVPGRAGRGALQHVPPACDPAAEEAPPPLAPLGGHGAVQHTQSFTHGQ